MLQLMHQAARLHQAEQEVELNTSCCSDAHIIWGYDGEVHRQCERRWCLWGKFLDGSIKYIVYDTMPSNYLPGSGWFTHVRYAHSAGLQWRREFGLLFLRAWALSVWLKDLGTTNVDNNLLYRSIPKIGFFHVWCGRFSFNDSTRPPHFHVPLLYLSARRSSEEPCLVSTHLLRSLAIIYGISKRYVGNCTGCGNVNQSVDPKYRALVTLWSFPKEGVSGAQRGQSQEASD